MSKLLTIGMCTYDDFDGVYFTIQSLGLYHKILQNIDYEIIVIDNNPSSSHGEATKSFINGWKQEKCRYIPYTQKKSTSIRNEIFNYSKSKYCLCIDCHVMIQDGGLEALINYFTEKEDCKDLIQGPLIYDNIKNYATEFLPIWNDRMYGKWNSDEKSVKTKKSFEINMMGLGLFACETKNWVGINPLFKGFGGEEGYLHEKFRKNKGKCICLSDLKWIHRFSRPNGVKYPLLIEDRIWNYYIGWLELTRDKNHQMIQEITDHFKKYVSNKSLIDILNLASKTMEID
jgi:hypothetical protein